jgi:hypothetical protein
MDLAPTNQEHSFQGMTWMHVRDGMINEGGDS